jgi:phosphatidylinositol alpha-1,6-mannosyltransferase
MRAQRVLVVTPDFPPAKGGIQVLTHRVVSSFESLTPIVVTLGHPDARAFDEAQPFRVTRVADGASTRAAAVMSMNARAVWVALWFRPDVVLSAHIISGPAAALLKRVFGVPFVQYVHAKELGARPGLARFALGRADRVIAVSNYAKQLAIHAGAPSERIALVHPGVDLARGVSIPRSARVRRPTIVTVARLEDRYKGHDVVLRALPLVRAKVSGVVWRIVGEGPLRPTLEDRVCALGLQDAVEFLGAVSDADRDAVLSDADVFCMVSRLPAGRFAGEGFGIVYLEANVHNLPVVAGAVGGATDAVLHNETGLLVDPDDHVAVADALIQLLTDHEMAARLAAAGAARARRLSWIDAGKRVESELLRLANGADPSRIGSLR